jgi:hypothetical protein
VIANRHHGDWYDLAQRQAGVITRSQALISGITDSSLRARAGAASVCSTGGDRRAGDAEPPDGG